MPENIYIISHLMQTKYIKNVQQIQYSDHKFQNI